MLKDENAKKCWGGDGRGSTFKRTSLDCKMKMQQYFLLILSLIAVIEIKTDMACNCY